MFLSLLCIEETGGERPSQVSKLKTLIVLKLLPLPFSPSSTLVPTPERASSPTLLSQPLRHYVYESWGKGQELRPIESRNLIFCHRLLLTLPAVISKSTKCDLSKKKFQKVPGKLVSGTFRVTAGDWDTQTILIGTRLVDRLELY